jgi:hypothetical protein
MKVIFCYALQTVVQGFGANETLHFRTTTFWAQLPFGGGGVAVWGCFSFDFKLDLYVLDGNLTGQKYRDKVQSPIHALYGSCLATSQTMELSEQPLAVKNVVQFGLYVA